MEQLLEVASQFPTVIYSTLLGIVVVYWIVGMLGLIDLDFSGDAAKTVKKFPKAKLYSDFRKMLDKEKDIDAVTISTPDHTHSSAAVYAMEREKHVYIQKPLTHNIKEARLLTNLAREKKVVSQMGNQGASNTNQDIMQEWIDSGKIGSISKVHVWGCCFL